MQVDVNHVIDSLSQQVAEQARARAFAEAQAQALASPVETTDPDNVVRGEFGGDNGAE